MLNQTDFSIIQLALAKGFKDTDIAHYVSVALFRVLNTRASLNIDTDAVTTTRWDQWARLAKAGVKAKEIAALYRVKELTVRTRLHQMKVLFRDVRANPNLEDAYASLRDIGVIDWRTFVEI